jgi:hypothetical protein
MSDFFAILPNNQQVLDNLFSCSMSAMTTYPILNVSETFIRQALYDNLSESVRAGIDFESFRPFVSHEDYRFFASAMSDLINDYVNENNIFTEFLGQAALETISQSESLAKLYVPGSIE